MNILRILLLLSFTASYNIFCADHAAAAAQALSSATFDKISFLLTKHAHNPEVVNHIVIFVQKIQTMLTQVHPHNGGLKDTILHFSHLADGSSLLLEPSREPLCRFCADRSMRLGYAQTKASLLEAALRQANPQDPIFTTLAQLTSRSNSTQSSSASSPALSSVIPQAPRTFSVSPCTTVDH